MGGCPVEDDEGVGKKTLKKKKALKFVLNLERF